MQQTPVEFRAAISHHNRHAVIGAFFSFLGALAGWAVVYALFVGAVLGVQTLVHGQDFAVGESTSLGVPRWLYPAAGGLCGVIMLLGLADHRIRRYRPVNDRQVIGWHLIAEVLLIPARLTISIFGHLSSMVLLKPIEKYEAWRLLWIVFQEKRLNVSEVGLHTAMRGAVSKLFSALQLVGWIDLHHKDDEWYYMVCSDREEEVRLMLGIPLPAEEDDDQPQA